jgi:anti-sigma regulatory factor (Ser/Thr protein kinase)
MALGRMDDRRSSEVGPQLSGVRSARRFVAAALQEWGVAAVDDILVVVSEMVTNALTHGEGPVGVVIECRDASVRFEVSDGSAVMPMARQVLADAPSGRGMRIVETLADRWGADLRPPGKTVWVEFDR